MSVGASTGSIHFSGVASGLDIDSLVTGLTAADQLPITDLQNEQTALQDKQAAYAAIRTGLQGFVTAMSALSKASEFQTVQAIALDPTVLGVTTGSGAAAGSYTVSTGALAQAQKVSSTAQNSATGALNLSGQFIVNGKAVTVAATDTLTTIANKINALGNGSLASVINGGTGQAYISIAATQTGLVNQVQLADLTGGVLSSLGIIGGAAGVRSAAGGAGTANSFSLSSATSPIGGLIGAPASGTVTINGTPISIDFSSDSLQTLAQKINATGTGMTATVKSSTDSSGNSSYYLQLGGTGVPAGISDPSHLFGAIGITQQGYSHQLVQAADASYTIDNLTLSSASNQISNVIPGVTFNLLKANSSTTVTVSQDTSSIVNDINTVQGAYNGLMDQIGQFTSFDATTNATGALLGDATTQTIAQGLASSLFKSSGSGKYTNMTQIGVTLDQSGKLQIDNTKLTAALSSNLSDVQNLLTSQGSTTSSSLTYVSSGSNTASSTGIGYDVNISQVATQSSYKGSVAQTSPLAQAESLTFGGPLFGVSGYSVSLDAGMTNADIVNTLNGDSKLSPLMTASLDSNGMLQLVTKRYGASSVFTLSSDVAGSSSSSGLGGGAAVSGVDVAGTISGELATGNGQFLIGNTGNKTTEGLQVQYTGNSVGDAGIVSFSAGAANNIDATINHWLGSVSGLLTSQDASVQTQITNLGTQISTLQKNMATKQNDLRTQFTAMETAISQLQAQSSALNLLSNSGSTSSSTSSSSSSSGGIKQA